MSRSLLLFPLMCAAFSADAQTGKNAYLARCSGCHGEDGSGGGHGPAIIGLPQPRATTAAEVSSLIAKGIPGTGMPAFRLPANEADAVARFVVELRSAPLAKPALPVSSDTDPGPGSRNGPSPYRAVSVRLRSGKTLRGLAKNESRFDLQLFDLNGQLHLLQKRDVAEVVPEPAELPVRITQLSRIKADVTDAHPQPGTWPTYNGTPGGNRYSPLSQINTSNVAKLAPKWMFTPPGTPRSLQMTPVVSDGVMYITSVNEVYALDARSGREIWHYRRPRTPQLAGDAAGSINRGVALLGDRVFLATDNAHLIALHRRTGQLLWDTTMADAKLNYGATSAPLVVNDLVISGVSGGDEGVRGFLDAYQASTGKLVWRFFAIPAPGEPGSETWQGRALEHGCGATWLTGTWDPENKLLFWPTGNPCPDYNGGERLGDNLYTSSVLALDPATGKLKWHYQFTPHDLHDWDAAQTPILIDAVFQGTPRKLLLQGNRNGFFYVLDRLTGKVLLAEPFVKQLTWASRIGADGRPVLLPGNEPTETGQLTCPSVAGAANWPSSAYSPLTGLYYLFAEESCNIYSKNDEWWKPGESFYGGATRRAPATKEGGKFLRALDLQTGKLKWEIPDIGGQILGSGLMATAGGLIFFGDGNGAFLAAEAKTGKILWHFNTGLSSRASPMTYLIDGNQYFGAVAGATVIAFGIQ